MCAAAACAVRVGAERRWDRSAFSPGQADPPHFERAGAPWEARARSNVPRRTLWWVVVVVVVVVRAPTPNYLRLASPDRGKYENLDRPFSEFLFTARTRVRRALQSGAVERTVV